MFAPMLLLAEEADFVIQATHLSDRPQAATTPGGNAAPAGMDDLLHLTSRFLRSPGLQREIVKVMLEDRQVGSKAGTAHTALVLHVSILHAA
jgi:hypothetical protein